MRNITIALNSVAAVFFACFLAYTCVARKHLESLARDFVTERTLRYSDPIVELADESLDSPLAKKLLSDNRLDHVTFLCLSSFASFLILFPLWLFLDGFTLVLSPPQGGVRTSMPCTAV